MGDATEIVRVLIGLIALLTAGYQVTVRLMTVSGFARDDQVRASKERVTSLAALLLLGGIGTGYLTHLHTPLTVSTVLISAGVLVAAFSSIGLQKWAVEEEKNGRARRRRPMKGIG